MTKDAQAALNEAYEAKKRGEWDNALALLREWQAYVDPALISYLRGSIWFDAGDAMLAGMFFENAHKLDPTNLSYASMFLRCLNICESQQGFARG